jgi:hypothetical protein
MGSGQQAVLENGSAEAVSGTGSSVTLPSSTPHTLIETMENYTQNASVDAPESLINTIVRSIVDKNEYHDVHLFGDAFARALVGRLTLEGFGVAETHDNFQGASFQAYLRGAGKACMLDIRVRSFYFLGCNVSIIVKKDIK